MPVTELALIVQPTNQPTNILTFKGTQCGFIVPLCVLGLQAVSKIGQEEGVKGFWRGNVPQVCMITHQE